MQPAPNRQSPRIMELPASLGFGRSPPSPPWSIQSGRAVQGGSLAGSFGEARYDDQDRPQEDPRGIRHGFAERRALPLPPAFRVLVQWRSVELYKKTVAW